MMFRPMPLMTVLTIASLVVLIVLGNWQWSKYADKIGRDPDQAADAPAAMPLGFTAAMAPGMQPQRVYGIADGEAIWRRYILAERRDTGAPVLLAVDATGGANPVRTGLGLTPADLATPRDVRIFPRPGGPSPRNKPDDDLWYKFDLSAILSHIGAPAGPIPVAEPVELTVRNAENPAQTRTTPNPYGAPKPIDPLPPERHFGYAL
ncbi:MAG: SURF1 family cytochrome oxidase biogenesis protein, partial [Pseudomonadota bacterium]